VDTLSSLYSAMSRSFVLSYFGTVNMNLRA